jgi:DNA-directed RNA polymerase subunit RPC12/RpoP
MNGASYYKLECHTCRQTIELPALDGRAQCPQCGAILLIDWHAERRGFDRRGD